MIIMILSVHSRLQHSRCEIATEAADVSFSATFEYDDEDIVLKAFSFMRCIRFPMDA